MCLRWDGAEWVLDLVVLMIELGLFFVCLRVFIGFECGCVWMVYDCFS